MLSCVALQQNTDNSPANTPALLLYICIATYNQPATMPKVQVRNNTIVLPYTIAAIVAVKYRHQGLGLRKDRMPAYFEGRVACALIKSHPGNAESFCRTPYATRRCPLFEIRKML